ncbi:hypothetical protein BX070DRAFT_263917 [Coemansia spiralis]|nr:hypothetical protein BX070DRAFT_263917 [Coemansia spiralis]
MAPSTRNSNQKQTNRKQQQQQPQVEPKSEHRTMWSIYKGVQPRYRILLGMGFMGFSILGLWVSDKLEEIYPPTPDSRVTHISHSDAVQVEDQVLYAWQRQSY